MTIPLNKIILFDLDNTLVQIHNNHHHFDQLIVEVFDKYNIPVPSLEQRDLLWRNMDYDKLLKSWNFPDSEMFWKEFDLIDYQKRKILLSESKIKIFEDVIPLLDILRASPHLILVIITNTTKIITDMELEAFNLKKYFSKIVTLGDFAQDVCKPSPTGIYWILEEFQLKHGIDLSNVYIVGDSAADISAGVNARIKTILINRKHKDLDQIPEKPDYIIQDMKELLEIIKN